MILNELTNADAIEGVREEAWKEAREATWKEAREATWDEAWKKAREVTSEATQQQILDLIGQGLTSEQIKQAIERGYLRVVSKPTSGRTDVK
jgi:anti-sigma28 factor (negative regulator of flagellin synthesis)